MITSAPGEHLVVTDLVLPSDSEHSPEASKVEDVQLVKLLAVERPRFRAVQENRDHNGIVYLDLCLQFNMPVEVHPTRQLSKRRACPADSVIYFSVQRTVVGYNTTKVREVLYFIESIATD